ncbi:hypothetical protein [Streptomyces tauricus]|uniref:hypothetical protein n=1 Tax=Streptomyces tauricus TaxID=68274 RepID=UPI00224493AA|nr:hypothetical protein [Streptomyces tauricus]MCW8103544.1 hypothetical protein [Streptomyces tauricus]
MHNPATLPDPFETAAQAFSALLDALGPGRHQLVCSAHTALGSFASASVDAEYAPDDQDEVDADSEGWLMFCHLLAQTSIGFRDAAIFTRTYTTDSASVVRGWKVTNGWPYPMDAADVFATYCTDLATGDPLPPEPGTDYQAGTPLPTASGSSRP